MNDSRHPWEDEAENWVRWARTPDHDVFSYFAPAFFEQILPPPHGLTLEIGCGEGRVVRELLSRSHVVVGLDASTTLVKHARAADARAIYLAGDGTRLPFADVSFETVVAYNSLQTMGEVGDMAEAVAEVGRVLQPGGHFCFCIAHPITDVALVRSGGERVDVAESGAYFDNVRVDNTVTQDGISMTFTGWTYTLEDYVRALDAAGMVIEAMREPRPTAEQVASRPSLARWRRLPLFLSVRALKPHVRA